MSNKNIYMAFGSAMSFKRKQLKMTQNDLASQAGLSRASIANIERGHQNVALHHLYAISEALEVSDVSVLLPSLKIVTESREDEVMMPTSEILSETSRVRVNDLIRKALKQSSHKSLDR